MERALKRTFIPPQNRPTIRGAQLRSARDSLHYLAIFNNPIRRQSFLKQLQVQCDLSSPESCGYTSSVDPSKNEETHIKVEELFGVEKSYFLELMADLNLMKEEGVNS